MQEIAKRVDEPTPPVKQVVSAARPVSRPVLRGLVSKTPQVHAGMPGGPRFTPAGLTGRL